MSKSVSTNEQKALWWWPEYKHMAAYCAWLGNSGLDRTGLLSSLIYNAAVEDSVFVELTRGKSNE